MSDQEKDAGQLPVMERSKENSSAGKKKLYDVFFFHTWCKSCGLCVAFCPKEIISADKTGKPAIVDADSCIGCRFCEMHCPDFAITVELRMPKRRKSDE